LKADPGKDITMPDYNAIVRFFDEYIAHYKKFLKFEYMKLDMINRDLIEQLSNSLSTEQAFIMKTNSLEAKREKLLKDTGDKTFAELAANAPPEFSPRLAKQHEELSEIIFKIKEINDCAGDIVNARLKKIQSMTAELDVYDGKGAVRHEHAVRAAISKNV